MSETAGSNKINLSTRGIIQIIGIFALAGVGIGATGGVAVSQLGAGSAILSGVLILVVLTIAFLLGPVIGLISGLRIGDTQGRSPESYITGLVGSVAGYFVMILAIVIIISVIMAITGGGSGESSAATQASTTDGSSSGLAIGEYLVPIIAVALPTGITGLGGVFFGGHNHTTGKSGVTLPTRYVPVTVAVIAIVVAGAIVAPSLLSSEPQLQVDGSTEFPQNSITADATITNPAESETTQTLTVELYIDGSEITSRSEEVTVPANDATRINWSLVEGSDLSESMIDAVNDGNMELRFKIDDTTVDTDSPDSS